MAKRHAHPRFYIHKIVYNGVEVRKVNLKFFSRLEPAGGPFTPTEVELDNVEFGKLSQPVDLPVIPLQNNLQFSYFIKTYDAETGQVLIDLSEDYGDGRMSDLNTHLGGKEVVVNIPTDD